MKLKLVLAASAAISIAFSAPSTAQTAPPGEAIVTLYRAAPGHQVMLLKWLEQQDRVAAEAGVPPSRLYVHQNGDSWDYLLLAPVTTAQQDAALEAASKKLGVPTGPGVGIELRKHITSHTDTIVSGPTSAADYLRSVGQ